MQFRLKAVALLGVAGAAVASAVVLTGPTARAATEHCGNYCETLASQSFGSGQVIAETGNGGTLLAPGYNPQEDFVALAVGTVSQLAETKKIPASLAPAYGNEVVYQFSYQPKGTETDTCLAASGLAAGSAVKVESCGYPKQLIPEDQLPTNTLWIGVHRDAKGDFEPFVNVAASKGSALVLTATSASGPLTINYMKIGSSGVASNQLWESLIGIYGQAQAWPTPNGNEPAWPDR
ncbi:MAG TPA: hypothetical protein VGG16_02390 [Streptosporangiaceae bacterium]|jgi:hypothetical protein